MTWTQAAAQVLASSAMATVVALWCSRARFEKRRAWFEKRRKIWQRLGLLDAIAIVSEQQQNLLNEGRPDAAAWGDFYFAGILREYLKRVPACEREQWLAHCPGRIAEIMRAADALEPRK